MVCEKQQATFVLLNTVDNVAIHANIASGRSLKVHYLSLENRGMCCLWSWKMVLKFRHKPCS